MYVGTADGHLVVYQLAATEDEEGRPTFVSKLDTKVNIKRGKKAVELVLVVPQIEKILTLCGKLCV